MGPDLTQHVAFAWLRCFIGSLLIALGAVSHAQAQPPAAPAPSRGELLYSNHCIECHNVQMHWRSLKQARDWDTLRAQVHRWQEIAKLGWSHADIDEVTRYLNDTIYQFAQPPDRASRLVLR